MKKLVRSFTALCLAMLLGLSLLSVGAAADETGGDALPANFLITGYTLARGRSIEKGDSVSITVELSRTDRSNESDISAVRSVDSFRGGTITAKNTGSSGLYELTIDKLTYTGSGNTLGFTVYCDGEHETLSLPIAECVPFTESTPDAPDAIPQPRAVFSADAIPSPIGANESRVVTVRVENVGEATMESPVLTFTPSDALALPGGQSSYTLRDIAPGESESMLLTVQATNKISTQTLSVEAAIDFYYDNDVSTVSGSGTGRISIASTPSEYIDPSEVESPVPTVILTGYSFGGSSVAAGSEADLSFTFLNTSKTIAIDNVTLTVTGGADLMLSGSTNTFYFDAVAAGGSRTVNVPLKAAQRINDSVQDIGIAFHYEYVDHNKRASSSATLSISVPLYQPDRFELSDPVAAYVGAVGEEIALTMDYVNKGKSAVSNVEAHISGDVESASAFQRVGNLDSGKSGTIAFAVTPMLEGDNAVKIVIAYEDANGEQKERVFETTLTAMAFEPYDPGMDMPIEPEETTGGFPWWIVIVVVVAAGVVLLFVLRAKKKKAKLQAEQALWDEWDEEDEGKQLPGAKKAEAAQQSEAKADSAADLAAAGAEEKSE